MASFLSESYPKPNLMEPRLVNKIINEQNNKIINEQNNKIINKQNTKITFEKKATLYIKNIIIKYWQHIIGLLIIIGLFYWRYKEIQNKRYNESRNKRYNESHNRYTDSRNRYTDSRNRYTESPNYYKESQNRKGYYSYESDSEDVTTEE